MKFSELGNVNFRIKPVWFYSPKQGAGKSYAQIRWEEELFKKQKEQLREGLVKSITEPIDRANSEEEIGIGLDPVLERLSKSFYVNNEVDGDLLIKKANRNTLNKKLQPWCYQCNANVDVVRSRPGVKIFHGKLKDVPAVVVAAGPSLKNAIDKLAPLKDKACIIATDTSLRGCVKRGFHPHFCNAHDANEAGERFFQGFETETIGVFVNYIHPKTIAAYGGPLVFYYVDDHSIAAYGTMARACDGPDRPDGSFLPSKIMGGSSVAHTALYYAIDMGCNPITFVGLDLCYPDLEKSHFETDNPKDVKNQRLLDVESITGDLLKTNLSFYSYKTVFEKMAPGIMQIFNVDIYTSTEDDKGRLHGVVHTGLRPMKFDEWIERFATKKRPELGRLHSIYEEYVKHGTKL